MGTVCVILLVLFARQAFGDAKLELLELQQSSDDGVIHFNTEKFETYAVGKSRSYALIFLLLADHLMDQPKLALKVLREEYGLAAKAYKEKYASGPRAGKVFFATMEVSQSAAVFQRLGAESLPFVFRLAPHEVISKAGKIELSQTDKMTFNDAPSYPWKAEAFANFVKTRTGVAVEEIPRTDAFASRILAVLLILFIAAVIWTARRLYDTPFVKSKWLWMAASLAVCWFSTSGAMFNIIRGVPFAMPSEGRLQWLYRGNGQQFGAEGFLMGSMYILFSAMIVVMTHGVPRIVNTSGRRAVLISSVGAAALILRHIVHIYSLKTGYHLQQYIF